MVAVRLASSGPFVELDVIGGAGSYVGQPVAWNGSAWAPLGVGAPLVLRGLASDGALELLPASDLLATIPGELTWTVAGVVAVVMSAVGVSIEAGAGGVVLSRAGSTEFVRLVPGEVGVQSLAIRLDSTELGFFGATPAARPSITGATEQEQIDALVAAGVAVGLWTDDR